ncbi:MAG: ankyrin repeat domain-containing protein [Azospirillaceae bacterium]|nr:ankyrin repeat domain-containing protein [Azospirillaceae bacterium]
MTPRSPFRRIDATEARRLLERDDVLVLDLRDAGSFADAHIAGAWNVSMANLSTVVDDTPRTTPILIYCYHGYASQEYASVFADFGFSRVYSLDGGYEAWRKGPPQAGDAVIDEPLRRWLAAQGFHGGDVNGAIENGTTPLMRASQRGELDIVRRLFAVGAVLDLRNHDGNNALWLACVGDHLDVIDALIGAGIDVDNRNDNGATPLMYAASAGKAVVVERLLLAGADRTSETLDGFTALDMASTLDCLALLRRMTRAA